MPTNEMIRTPTPLHGSAPGGLFPFSKIHDNVTQGIIHTRHYDGEPGVWTLTRPFRFVYLVDGILVEMIIPEGFRFDGHSVPRIAWPFISRWNRATTAALVHDFLYARQYTSRREADNLYSEIWKNQIELSNVLIRRTSKIKIRDAISNFKRVIAWGAVRTFGWVAWNRNK